MELQLDSEDNNQGLENPFWVKKILELNKKKEKSEKISPSLTDEKQRIRY